MNTKTEDCANKIVALPSIFRNNTIGGSGKFPYSPDTSKLKDLSIQGICTYLLYWIINVIFN